MNCVPRRWRSALTALLLACSVAAAQHQHHEAGQGPKPAELLEGLGNHSHPIRTTSTESQRFFDQGLALIYGFNHDEAARLFARAAELDPKSPMPHWGIALALGPNYNMPPMPEREKKAWEAIEQAVALSKAAPEAERDYVQALVRRYSRDPNADRKGLAVDYREAMRSVSAKHPDDLDAATLYAESIMNLRPWQLWSAAGEPAEGTLEAVGLLERVLRRNPEHPGANHYLIHALEASPAPERALPSATRLGSLMPGAGHMVHMPSHIYIRLGDYRRSVDVNVLAARVDENYIRRTGAKGAYPLMYYSHNLHFVSYAQMYQGREEDALDYARRLRGNVTGAIDDMSMLVPYGAFEWLVMTTFGRWDDILKQPEPKEKSAFLHALYRYARGAAFAGKGSAREAEAERERLQSLESRIPETETAMINNARSLVAIGLADLEARISRCKGDGASEVSHLKRAVEMQDRLAYMEPPEWHSNTRTALGGALLRAGKASEAEAVFRKDLELNPRNARSLFGLMKALEGQSKVDAVHWVKQEFSQAWENATASLTVESL
ncbi:MAG: hypothetical protein H7039_18665 [Bryobacteraceae bacterium]|nr:hypothetical protein [Bryobacteraceae bacterium]